MTGWRKGVAKMFDLEPQIQCDGVIKDFRKKELFMGQRYLKIEDQKPCSKLARVTRIWLSGST